MDKNVFRWIIGALLVATAIQVLKPNSRFEASPLPAEQELVPVRAPVPEPEPPTTDSVSNAEATASTDPTAFIQRVREVLPRRSQIHFENTEDMHHLHPAILTAGLEMGRLKELWMQKAEVRKPALDFYEQCTFDSQLVESVRALCYISAVEVSVYLNKTEKVMSWSLDSSVQNLSSRLMSE